MLMRMRMQGCEIIRFACLLTYPTASVPQPCATYLFTILYPLGKDRLNASKLELTLINIYRPSCSIRVAI